MLLSIEQLHVDFDTYSGKKKVLKGVDLRIDEGEMFGLIGESGAGKSILARSIIRMISFPGIISSGKIIFDDKNILELEDKEVEKIRGNEISTIVALPKTRLDPLVPVGQQILDVYRTHRMCTKKEAYERVIEILKDTSINDPERRFHSYPHELSGGMAQRILIAMAMITSPKLLIADDATSGLDVTVQAQVLDNMAQMVKEKKSAALIITHDLGIVAQYCKKCAIMYEGKIVEKGNVVDVFLKPQHKYSQKLIGSLGLIV